MNSHTEYLKYLQRKASRLFGSKAHFSGEYHEANSCRRKIRYSKESAIRAAVAMQAKTGNVFDTYECEFCGGYHIGRPQRDPIKQDR